MKKYYWMGPGSLKTDKGKIQPDKEIPPAVIEKMSERKLKSLIDAKKISHEPRSAALQRVAQNAKNKIEALEEGGKKMVDKFNKIIEARDKIIEGLKERFKRKTEDFKKAQEKPGDLEKENKKLSDKLANALKDREKALEEVKTAMKDVRVMFLENESFKKTLSDCQKKYKVLQKERDTLEAK